MKLVNQPRNRFSLRNMSGKGLCVGNKDLFFPESETEENCADAKALCAICPIKDLCRDLFYSYPDHADMPGVWFGTTAEERNATEPSI